ncbi:hypothetical protein [Burkholderia plantarii]|uniref:hypothetical protein n=1 Tax=Burkholderia plantarii TaxID=41899 RepID=UPI0018DD4FF1|nr:hypothetical protein [Burkholderia plantarii]MBI0326943.1 hypothetical protein [Burkholderia plantarii]
MRPQVFNLFATAPTLAAEIAAATARASAQRPIGAAGPAQALIDGEWRDVNATDMQRVAVPMVGGLGGDHGFNVNRWTLQREQAALRQAADEAVQEVAVPARGRRRL